MSKKVLMVAKTLFVFMLLSSFFIFSASAENTPYTDKEIEKIGVDQFKILGLHGIHRFNLSEPGSSCFSEGYVLFANTYDTPITIKLATTNKLSIMDLDENGEPRIHDKSDPPVHESVIFYPIYDLSWINLEETVFTIDPLSSYRAYYTVEMSKDSVWKHIDENTDNGFLGYITIKQKKDANIGMNIGIDYRYKVFTIFTCETAPEAFFIDLVYIIIPIGIVTAICTVIFFARKLEWIEVEEGGPS